MRFERISIISVLVGILSLCMLVPCVQAVTDGDWKSARSFLYASAFGLFTAGVFAQLMNPMGVELPARREVLRLILTWTALPALAALPVVMITPQIGPFAAYVEMVAAMTTTGGTVYRRLAEVPDALHLWRGLVAWYGGLLTLMAAYVILAPRRLGGFEVTLAVRGDLLYSRPVELHVPTASLAIRFNRALRVILPVYTGLTVALALIFSALDQPGLVATVHAMGVVSTSGISPLDGGMAALQNYWVELAALGFMVLAASRVFYAKASQTGYSFRWYEDPELRLMGVLVAVVVATLFLRHWVGALTISGKVDDTNGFAALWGALFTAVSFITTTGFESAAWQSARDWSGHENPGLVLLALCAVGGGAATTAGGVKLIRAYALIRHGMRELDRIAQPFGVATTGGRMRGLRREGAFIAWAFMMLFILALLVSVLGLTLTGLEFRDALVAAVAALSNTGPAMAVLSEGGTGLEALDNASRAILVLAMVLGRIETLAVIALLNPDSWGRFSMRTKNAGKSEEDSSKSGW